MNRPALVIAAIVTLALGIAAYLLGQNLILSLPTMQQRGGGGAWYVTWAMVWITVLSAVVLAWFLLASTTGKRSR
jgi:hypothetical protein